MPTVVTKERMRRRPAMNPSEVPACDAKSPAVRRRDARYRGRGGLQSCAGRHPDAAGDAAALRRAAMNAEVSQQHVGRAVAGGVARSDRIDLRLFVIVAGVAWASLFIVVGFVYELQTYGDGATFSYAVAAEDSWAFHWHNIAGRLVVYLLSSAPGEIYVAATGDARGGIAI